MILIHGVSLVSLVALARYGRFEVTLDDQRDELAFVEVIDTELARALATCGRLEKSWARSLGACRDRRWVMGARHHVQ